MHYDTAPHIVNPGDTFILGNVLYQAKLFGRAPFASCSHCAFQGQILCAEAPMCPENMAFVMAPAATATSEEKLA